MLKHIVDRPFRVLFVCTANICRSPLAERLFPLALGMDERDGFRANSAGVHAYDGLEMDPSAAAQLCRLGGDPAAFRSRQLTDQACADSDLILTMTREHRSDVLQRSPRALRRTFTLLEFVHANLGEPDAQPPGDPGTLKSRAAVVAKAAASRGLSRPPEYDIADPFRESEEQHQQVADIIHAAVESLAARLTKPSAHWAVQDSSPPMDR